MKYQKSKNGSYIHNSLIKRRLDTSTTIISQNGVENTSVSLNGYAIIPLDEYRKYIGERMTEEENERIRNADKDLRLPPQKKIAKYYYTVLGAL